MPPFLTTRQAAIFLGVSPSRVRQFVAEGRLKPAGRNLFSAEAVRQFRKPPPGLLTTAQAAKRLGVSAGRVRQLVAEKRLPVAEKFGKWNIFKLADVLALRGRKNGRPPTKSSRRRTTRNAKPG